MHDEVSRLVARQYSAYAYPEPITDMAEAIARGHHEFATPHKFLPLLWPEGRNLDGLRILIAGCGTNQAAYNAMMHPGAEVLGIDLSRPSLEHSQYLKDKHGLGNLQLRQMSLLDVAELGQRFDYIACTGVLHHLADPDTGLRALAGVLAPEGMLNLMLYGQHARAGVYLLQEAFRRLGCGQGAEDVALVRATLESLDPKHSIHAYLPSANDLKYDAGIVDTFLHPQDRAYTVPQVMDFLQSNGLSFWSWADRLFYNPLATIPVTHPLQARLAQLPELERWVIVDLLTQARGTHRFLACHPARAASGLRIDFNDPAWLSFVPLARPGLTVAEPGDPTAGRRPRLQRLWHSFELTPIGAALLEQVDGRRSIEGVLTQARAALPGVTQAQAREFFALMHDWGHLLYWRDKQVHSDKTQAREGLSWPVLSFPAAGQLANFFGPAYPSYMSSKTHLNAAQQHAQSGLFPQMLAECRSILETPNIPPASLLDVGVLLFNFGFLSQAQVCFDKARALSPNDLVPTINLANVARDMGNHAEARELYSKLLAQLPDHPVIRRNALTSLEYDPHVTDSERLSHAQAWGQWAIARSGGFRPRPNLTPLDGCPLRIGYVGADFCQHTVGLFVKDVLKAHDRSQVQVFVYSSGPVKDWVTDEIRTACTFLDVSTLDDAALVAQVRADGINVLVDLSGHTAGSRLTAFAHRPAPVMVSWLGYFATTGLPYLDAVLLDEWHAPPGTKAQFVEPIMRLPGGRFCYQPVPWAPAEVSVPAFERNGFITFGCFNNTAKFNPGVFDAWARVLHAVPDARLILKWRTFNDDAFRQQVAEAFVARGIAAERIELRGPSFHADLLKEYADIDIALDPFPFTGGLTSCEALWMGVPVVTLPQSRVVSRQTHAFLHQIDLPELSARDADDYVRIATELANGRERLAELRASLREKMHASPMMDVTRFTRQLEDTLIDLYRRIEGEESHRAMNAKTILHVGPGHRNNGAKLPAAFQGSEWQEIRLDIDPANEPDIVGSMLDMAAVADASVDAIYSAHNIEHVYAHEVPQVLNEFLRVLKPDGFLVVTCPDLQTVCQLVAEDKLNDAAYTSPAGPITPLDILYGHGAALAAGHLYMAHKTGFTLKTLTQALHAAGFATSAGKRRARGLDLWVVASKGAMEEAALRELAGKVLPG